RKFYIYYMMEKIENSKIAAENNDIQMLTENNIKFHDFFIQACESEKLIQQIQTLRAKSYLIRSQSLLKKQNYLVSLEKHEKILEIIIQGAVIEVENFVKHHILTAGSRNLSDLNKDNQHIINYYKAQKKEE